MSDFGIGSGMIPSAHNFNSINRAAAEEARRAVVRLISGERDAGDMSSLLLYLRNKSFGEALVAELGHCVAHSDQRDRGIAWRRASDWALHVELQFAAYGYGGLKINPPDKATIEAGLTAALRIWGPQDTKKTMKMPYHKAKRALNSALPKISGIRENNVQVTENLNKEEFTVVSFLLRHIICRPAFDASTVMKSFLIALSKNRLLAKEEGSAWLSVQPFVSAFIVNLLHNTAILLPNGEIVWLLGGIRTDEASRYVDIDMRHHLGGAQMARPISAPLYLSELLAHQWCDAQLAGPPEDESGQWHGPIRLSQEGRLEAGPGLRWIGGYELELGESSPLEPGYQG